MFKKTETINVTNYLTKRKGCYESMIINNSFCLRFNDFVSTQGFDVSP